MPRKRNTNARTPRRTVSRISNSRIELEVDVSDTAFVEESDNTKPQEQTNSESTTTDQKKSLRSHLEARLLYRLSPTVRILQMFGCFPSAFDYGLPKESKSVKERAYTTTVTTVLKLFTLALLAGNAVLFVHNIQAMYASQEQLGILHAITVSWVITGLKPLVNAVQFALYFFKADHHRRVLERLQAVDDQYFVLTGHRVHGVQDANIFMIRLTTWSLLFSFVFRIVDIGAQGFEGLLAHWLNAISPLLVPLLTAWNVIPLGYFFILHRIVRHWFDDLSRQLKADKFLQNRSLSEYFRYYKLLTDVLTEIRDLFNFWIAFSLSWALMCLCLAIFFVTQAPIFADAPEEFEMSAEDEIAFRIAIAFNLSWSLIQILVAIGFILVISISGIKTNETVGRYFCVECH
uniref:Gustatory receptor n=1 Tax=Plectus sambesii TaxID=2011161 RepID=A0A914W7S9_9BILA